MREALILLYEGEDIPKFLSRAEKVYNQVKIGDNVKFELFRDVLKPDQMFFQFVFSEDQRLMRVLKSMS